ncbi:MAG: hypothetical protein RLZZ324_15 [Candidatus Parcubacteria bacterium]|jgi:hypothetical protein
MTTVPSNPISPLAIIIPGYTEIVFGNGYFEMTRALTHAGWRVLPIFIDWQSGLFPEWRQQLLAQVRGFGNVDLCIGFSYGAILALEISKSQSVHTVFAASTSPVFCEQHALRTEEYRMANKEELASLSGVTLASLKDSRAVHVRFFMGTDDFPLCMTEIPNVQRAIGEHRSSLTWIPEATHSISHPAYVDAMCRAIMQEAERL